MFKYFIKNSNLFFSNINRNCILGKFGSIISNSSFTIKSNFDLKEDDENLADNVNFLKEKQLEVGHEADKINSIKYLEQENHDLKIEDIKLKYRIEHLIATIETLENNYNLK